MDSKVDVLMSEVNEEKTSGDFREMGKRLAQEVTSFVKKKMDKASRSGSLRNIKLASKLKKEVRVDVNWDNWLMSTSN